MHPQFGASTNPSIFLRLKASDPQPREVAWDEFRVRYVPVIAGFARRLGCKPQDVDDVIQDVLLGFFLRSPTFVYDPSKGRFRRYLKVCTYHALHKRLGAGVRLLGRPLDEIDPDSVAVEQVWNDAWEQQLLSLAIEEIRRDSGHTRAFSAFEQHVVQDRSAEVVAKELGLHIKSVYRAKDQFTRLLKARLSALRDED
jgi:RNA polymerase sigma-70 factor (ECF subfamily)